MRRIIAPRHTRPMIIAMLRFDFGAFESIGGGEAFIGGTYAGGSSSSIMALNGNHSAQPSRQ
jgi:hypothetical protein